MQELFEKSGSYFRATILADSCLHRQRAQNKVDLAASVADQLRACSQAQLKPSAEPDEGCSSLFQVLRQKRRAKEWERERFGFHS